MVTSYLNALLAADVVGRLLPSSLSAQTIAQEHFSQAAILLYSLCVTRHLLRRSTKVGAAPLPPLSLSSPHFCCQTEPKSGLRLTEWDLYAARHSRRTFTFY